MPSASVLRQAFLSRAVDGYGSWLAGSKLAPGTCRTYRQQVGWFAAWLAGQPRVAGSLIGPAGFWFSDGPGGVRTRRLGEEETAARQRAADRAAGLYHRHLADTGAAPASVKLAMSAAGSWYQMLGLQPPVIEDRAGTRPHKRPRTLTGPERRQILAAAAARGSRDLAMAALADDAGLRPGEIVGVDLVDVSPEGEAVRVRGGVYDHRSRVVPVTGQGAREAVAAWRAERALMRAEDPALFVTRRGRRIALRTVEHVISQIGSAAGVRVSPVLFRSTRTAELADSGMPAAEIAGRLGHARTETLRPYQGTPAAGRG